MSWKDVLTQSVAGIVTAIVLGILTLIWNWASQGGLIRLLGGITPAELEVQLAANRPGLAGPPSQVSPKASEVLAGKWNNTGLEMISPGWVNNVSATIDGNQVKLDYSAYHFSIPPRIVVSQASHEWWVFLDSVNKDFARIGLQNTGDNHPFDPKGKFWFLIFPAESKSGKQ